MLPLLVRIDNNNNNDENDDEVDGGNRSIRVAMQIGPVYNVNIGILHSPAQPSVCLSGPQQWCKIERTNDWESPCWVDMCWHVHDKCCDYEANIFFCFVRTDSSKRLVHSTGYKCNHPSWRSLSADQWNLSIIWLWFIVCHCLNYNHVIILLATNSLCHRRLQPLKFCVSFIVWKWTVDLFFIECTPNQGNGDKFCPKGNRVTQLENITFQTISISLAIMFDTKLTDRFCSEYIYILDWYHWSMW